MLSVRLSPAVVLLVVLFLVRCPSALADGPIGTSGPLPLFFIANRGQFDHQVKYYLQAGDRMFYFTSGGVTMVLVRPSPSSHYRLRHKVLADRRKQARLWAARLDFTAANPLTIPRGRHPQPTTFSYFRGSPEQWRTAVATYSEVVYEGLWPGVDLVFTAGRSQLKYTFIVHPGADPDRIRLAYRGAGISLTGSGELMIDTPVGGLVDQAPMAWQDRPFSSRQTVPCRYALDEDDGSGHRGYRFRVGSYDHTLPLVLDPGFVVYSRLIGGAGGEYGAGGDYGRAIAVDDKGNAYITGYTFSADFPYTIGQIYVGIDGYTDVFVAKISPDGAGLVYCCFIGGSNDDYGYGIAVDDTGSAYVTGYTKSTDFPHTVMVPHAGTADLFVVKVRPDGDGLVYGRLIGGTSDDRGYGIAVDDAGNAYVTGYTVSANFPTTVGPAKPGGDDVFVVKVRPDGISPVYSRLIGGSSGDYGQGIAVDSQGHAYVTGYTDSGYFSSPVSLALGGDVVKQNVFVAKFRPDGSGLVYFGLMGGSEDDYGYAIDVDGGGNAAITGYTASADFPRTVGPLHAGSRDVFVAKIRPDGTALVYSRLLGGNGDDDGYGIALDGAGYAYVTGRTNSADFPRTVGSDHAGESDVFVTRVRPEGDSLAFCGLIGEAGAESGQGIAVDRAGNAYVTGYTDSTDFPRTSGPDPAGGFDVFVAKVRSAFPWTIFYPALFPHGE